MSHEFFQYEQVRTILIVVSGKGMPEGVAGKAVFPSKFILMETDIVRDTLVVDRSGRVPFLGEKEVTRAFLYRQGIHQYWRMSCQAVSESWAYLEERFLEERMRILPLECSMSEHLK